ncbi:delta-like protein B isoform X2 [Watersipora subatra]
MCNIRTRIALLLFIITEVSSTGQFELNLLEFSNTNGLLNNRSCCVGPTPDRDICTGQCSTYFKICVKPYQERVTDGNCAFGEYVSNVIPNNNSFLFPQNVYEFTNPLVFSVDYVWPGDFGLIIEAYHASHGIQDPLIASMRGSHALGSGDGWVLEQYNSSDHSHSIRFQYRMKCSENYYGPFCDLFCEDRDDELGRYECDENGGKVCRQGWQGEYCDKAICLEGCSDEHGECSKPNECSCRLGWGGILCNECVKYPDCQHGYCREAFECICEEGWGGLYCNQDLNYCTHNRPCQNGGSCTNTGEGSYTCSCPIGYGGVNCEIEYDDCHRQPCLNGGTCKDVGNDYMCECPSGFSGTTCAISAERCSEMPCANGGTCEAVGESYRCHCADGWSGVNCQQERNECQRVAEPCQNGGLCIDGENTYMCQCLPGFSGLYCEINNDECEGENPCLNSGMCEDDVNGFRCRCKPGFMGRLCEIDIDECQARPCANGGSCRDKENGFQCFCAPGYTGRMCNEETNSCNPNQCMNGGRCATQGPGFHCICPSDYEGDLCQYRLGQAPSTRTTSRPVSTSRFFTTVSEVFFTPQTGAKTGESVVPPKGQVELTQSQLVMIICLASGVPMCLLFVLVITLLCRRCKRRVTEDKSVEEGQNAYNSGMNNKVQNTMLTNSDKSKPDPYPTTERNIFHETEASAHVRSVSLHNRNSAAATPHKVVHKDLIKDINRENERQLINRNNALFAQSAMQRSLGTEKFIPYYSGTEPQHSHWSNCHSTNNASNIHISTVCDTVLLTGGGPQKPDIRNTSSCHRNSESESTFRPTSHVSSLLYDQPRTTDITCDI